MTRYAPLFSLLLATSVAFAQDVHFTPFDAAPLVLNPSYTGMFDGKVRASTLYQNAWASITVPYTTYGLGVDMPVFTEHNGSYLGVGVQLLKDQAGDGNLSNFYGVASVAYHRILSKPRNERSCELAIGVQGGYAQKDIDIASMYFGDEFANGTFTPPNSLGVGISINAYKINTGISFSHSTGRKFSYTIGLAGNNLNQPNDAIDKKQNSQVGLDMNYSATVGINWLAAKRLSIRPAFYYCVKASTTYFISGTELQYNLGKGVKHPIVPNVFLGAWYRSGDAITCTVGIQLAGFRFGMGYDYNISALNATSNGSGSIMCMLRYIAPQKASARKRIVSCNRF